MFAEEFEFDYHHYELFFLFSSFFEIRMSIFLKNFFIVELEMFEYLNSAKKYSQINTTAISSI